MSLFYGCFRKLCSCVNQIAFHDYQKKLQNQQFSRIVHLASTRALVLAALGCSWRVLLALGSSLGSHGSSWLLLAEIYGNHRFIKQHHIFHSPWLLLTFPMSCILNHSQFTKTIVLSTSGSTARKL